MAEHYARDEAPLVIHPTEASIHEHFNNIIYRVNQRREEMITAFRDRMEERRAATTTRLNTIQQLIDSKADLQSRMKENLLHSMREKMLEDIDPKMAQLQVVEKETEVVFECDTRQLEQTISVLGQLIQREIISTPDYPALLLPSVSVVKEGAAEGELNRPTGVAFDEKSKLIYAANQGAFGLPGIVNSANISLFSITGEYIDRFCEGQVRNPYGIAISDNNVFLSDRESHCVYKFTLPKFQLVTKVGKYGTGVNEFKYPRYLSVTTYRSVLVADCYNHRIVVMNTDLKYKRYIKHQTMTLPTDVKVNNNKLYVLSTNDSPCLHVFSLTGEKISSLITRDDKGNAQVRICYSFCFDKKHNILMSDYAAGNIKVFSQEGALLHSLGDTQDRDKTIKPDGITLTDSNNIICTSNKTKFGLHIF